MLLKLLRFSLPLSFSLLLQIGQQIVNTYFFGHISKAALSAGTLYWINFITIAVIFIGLLSAIGIELSHALGRKNKHDMKRIFQQGIYFALALLPIALLTAYGMPYFFRFIHTDPSIVALSKNFSEGFIWGIPPFLAFFVLRDYCSVMKKTHYIVIAMVLGILSNALLDKLFIQQNVADPMFCIGLATGISEWILLFSLVFMLSKEPYFRDFLSWPFEPPSIDLFKKMLSLGFPIGLITLFEAGLFAVSALMMAHYGIYILAAHQIVIQWVEISFMIIFGLAQASTLMLSYEMGSGRKENIKPLALASLFLALLYSLIFAILFHYFPFSLMAVFSQENNPVFLSAIMLFFHIAVFFQFCDSLQIISGGLLRGIKDTLVPMLLGLGSYWVIGIGSAFLFSFGFHEGPLGIWEGLTLGLLTSGILLLGRFILRYKKIAKSF